MAMPGSRERGVWIVLVSKFTFQNSLVIGVVDSDPHPDLHPHPDPDPHGSASK
jgi:hypothetical protein